MIVKCNCTKNLFPDGVSNYYIVYWKNKLFISIFYDLIAGSQSHEPVPTPEETTVPPHFRSFQEKINKIVNLHYLDCHHAASLQHISSCIYLKYLKQIWRSTKINVGLCFFVKVVNIVTLRH